MQHEASIDFRKADTSRTLAVLLPPGQIHGEQRTDVSITPSLKQPEMEICVEQLAMPDCCKAGACSMLDLL